ncbi:MAG: PadR family transcriptional regulator [Pseudomonadales bacterium]|nr:PadR family transcriptional regulator [Pseudomonadales bacterium]
MSLKHVLLVVLKKRNSTGYEITKWFDGPLGHFWNTSHQRVYRALATLYKDGWVDFEEIQQDNKPNKKVYELTAVGEDALRRWLDTPLKPQPINEAFLVKLFAGKEADRKLLYDELLRQFEEHESLLKVYKKIEQEYFPNGFTGDAENDMMYLTLRRGFYHEEACIGWSKEAISVLESLL